MLLSDPRHLFWWLPHLIGGMQVHNICLVTLHTNWKWGSCYYLGVLGKHSFTLLAATASSLQLITSSLSSNLLIKQSLKFLTPAPHYCVSNETTQLQSITCGNGRVVNCYNYPSRHSYIHHTGSAGSRDKKGQWNDDSAHCYSPRLSRYIYSLLWQYYHNSLHESDGIIVYKDRAIIKSTKQI